MLRSVPGSLQESSSRRIASAFVCLPVHLSNHLASAPVGFVDPGRSVDWVLLSHRGPVTACATAMQAPSSTQTKMVPVEELRSAISQAVSSLGYSEAETEIVVEVLMWAELRSNSQGCIKLVAGALSRQAGASSPQLQQDTPVSASLDGAQQLGMLAMQHALQIALQKAKQSGIALVGVHNTSSSEGALGYYVEQLARQGYVGIMMSQSPEFVAPHGSSQAVFGTNPIAIACPQAHGHAPLVVDFATSATTLYDLVAAQEAGQEVEPDVGYDRQGQPSTSPAAILGGGAIRTFGGPKGSAAALICELLGGALAGGAVLDKHNVRSWGNLLIAISPALLGSAEAFRQKVTDLAEAVRGARPVQPGQPVRLSGDGSSQRAEEALARGTLEVNPGLLDKLRQLAASGASAADGTGHLSDSESHAHQQHQPGQPSSSNGSTPAPGDGASVPQVQPTEIAPLLGGDWALATRLTHPRAVPEDPYHATAAPLYQTATFQQENAVECGPYDYTRSGNPTRHMLERQLADIEGAARSFAFASGMAALAAVLRLAQAGDHVVAGDDLYGGTSRLLAQVAPQLGLKVTHVDTSTTEAVKAAMQPGKTRLVMLESPTNPRMGICDLKALCEIARQGGAISVVDNSMLAPMFAQPLSLGADICMTSATKFIGGHSDLTAGILSVKEEELAKRVAFVQNAEGAILGPFDCWLALRGLTTMALRMERQASTAALLAQHLAQHPLVQQVNYPGLASHPGHEVHQRQATSGGSLLSFTTGNLEASRILVERTQLFKIVVSFGSVSSSISLPCYMSHASIPADVRAARGLPDDLVRISVGIEDPQDLLRDLDQALQLAEQASCR